MHKSTNLPQNNVKSVFLLQETIANLNAEALQWKKLLALQAFEAFYNANNLVLKESEDADQHIRVLARKLRLYRKENEVLIKKITKIEDMIQERLKHQEKINKIIDHVSRINEFIEFRKNELDEAKIFMDTTFVDQSKIELMALEKMAGPGRGKIEKCLAYHDLTINRLKMSLMGIKFELKKNNDLKNVDIFCYSQTLLETVPEKPKSVGTSLLVPVQSRDPSPRRCKCTKTQCSTDRCGCAINNVPCTPSCGCQGACRRSQLN